MAFTATDMRVKFLPQRLGAVCVNEYPAFQEWKGAFKFRFQDHMGAGICACNFWNRACKAQIGRPAERGGGAIEQAAFFQGPAAKVISVKIAAFFTSGCTHFLVGSLYACQVITVASVNPDRIALFHKIGYLNF
jgi:hypothetical protein